MAESNEPLTAKEMKKQLCEWEQIFAEINGRKPKKDDICLAPPNIRSLYKRYVELKRPKSSKNLISTVTEKPIFIGSTLPQFKPKELPQPSITAHPVLKIQSTPVVPAVTKKIIKLPIDFRPNISPRIEINSDDCVETLFGIAPKLFNSGTSAIITDYEIESLKNLCPIFHKPQCHFIQPDVLPSTSASQENGSGEEPVDEDRPFEDSNNPRKRKLDGTEATEESQQDPKRVCLSEDAVPQAKKPFKPAKRAIRRNLAGFKLQLNKRRYVAVGAKQLRNAKFSSKKKFSNWKGRKNFGR